ncbi:phosphoribosylformylglycinamidine cyclo-ligase [bacterium]|nr:phosphoribosylformylglycinamidine cyclo-ligase [bacterium]
MKKGELYKAAGVDLTAADNAKKKIAALAKKTFTKGVVSDIGAFGGIFRFPEGSENLLLSSADGVGTKLKVATASKKYNTVGQDLVNHCVNDLLTLNATPLFFLDYIGHCDLPIERIAEIVEGLSIACSANGLALIGGETAQMPGIYSSGDFDLVGFIVGSASKQSLVDGSAIRPGDKLIALQSNGLQTNGYSLARKILIDSSAYALDDRPDILKGISVGEALLAVHPSYLKPVKSLIDKGINISGMAHITGGGIPGNLVRVLPKNCRAIVDVSQISIPPIFELIRHAGEVPISEMYDVFNMGAGFVIVLTADMQNKALALCESSEIFAVSCGEIVSGERSIKIDGVN